MACPATVITAWGSSWSIAAAPVWLSAETASVPVPVTSIVPPICSSSPGLTVRLSPICSVPTPFVRTSALTAMALVPVVITLGVLVPSWITAVSLPAATVPPDQLPSVVRVPDPVQTSLVRLVVSTVSPVPVVTVNPPPDSEYVPGVNAPVTKPSEATMLPLSSSARMLSLL